MATISDMMETQAADIRSAPVAGVPFRGLSDLPESVRDTAVLHGLGFGRREIARQLGTTSEAVSQTLARHRRCLVRMDAAMELPGLSARAVNALGRHGIRSREEGRSRGIVRLLQNERNCGLKTVEEIQRWLDGNDQRPASPC